MNLIDGVQTKSLRAIPDERGYLMEMLRILPHDPSIPYNWVIEER